MNVVLIITDTQPTWFVGAYGNGETCGTPNLDAMAERGVRFDRAYTSCPLCTPARSALFTGLPPSRNGAFANELSPGRHWPYLGEILAAHGVRFAYTGKWHLDASGYSGSGLPDGGATDALWYDKTRYVEDVGKERVAAIAGAAQSNDVAALKNLAVDEEELWGYRVASRAVDFLRDASVSEESFVLVTSFDEPHGPFACPPSYFERFMDHPLPKPQNYNAPLAGKPELQRRQRDQFPPGDWDEFAHERVKHMACNSWIDTQIGRVLDAVETYVPDDTVVIFTSDHGDQNGSHGLRSKGPMMYEESVRVPLIATGPGFQESSASRELRSHLDFFPTVLDCLEIPVPDGYPGVSLRSSVRDREAVFVEFNRFGLYHEGMGEFYPVRAAVTDQHKLVVNLFDTDELYDLSEQPSETMNRIDDPRLAETRETLLSAILRNQREVSDPLRGGVWSDRYWRSDRQGRRAYFFEPVTERAPIPAWTRQPLGTIASNEEQS